MKTALQVGLRLEDLHQLTAGQVYGILAEVANDDVKWKQLATAEDIAREFG